MGPVLVLLACELVFTVLCHALFFTVLIDRPQLSVRRSAAIGDVALTALLCLIAAFAPYEGEHRQRCGPAFAAYGFDTGSLASFDDRDPCAVAGQLLVTFSWTMLILVTLLVGLWWWSGDS